MSNRSRTAWLGVCVLEDRANPNTFTVTTTDWGDPLTPGTMAWALQNANYTSPVPDEIDISLNAAGTITFPEPAEIVEPVTIRSTGPAVTFTSPNGEALKFTHSKYSGEPSEVSDITFQNCAGMVDGGAVTLTKGELHIEDCTFSKNTGARGGAIYVGDDTTLEFV